MLLLTVLNGNDGNASDSNHANKCTGNNRNKREQ